MGGEASTSHEVPHLLWEAPTSSNHFTKVAKHTLHERMHPPFVEMSWISSFMVEYAPI